MRYAAAAQATSRVTMKTGIPMDSFPTGTEIIMGWWRF